MTLIDTGKEITIYWDHVKSNSNILTCSHRPELHRIAFESVVLNQHFFVVQDSVWGGTGSSSLYQSNHTSGQQQRFETVTSGKKKKKQKMVRADPSLLGESKRPSAKSEKSAAMCRCFSFLIFPFLFSRFFCECVIWEIEYGRDWDFGGLLRDCSQANPTDCIRFEQQLFYPNPCRGPLDCFHNLHLLFSVSHLSDILQIVNKRWSLRRVFLWPADL